MTLQYNFINPKTPKYNKGLLVIDSDDGNAGDYNRWFPITSRISREQSQWIGDDVVVICPSVNTATIGTTGKMTVEQLKELVSRGWEITAHGRHHYGLGELRLNSPVEAGATQLEIEGAGQIRVEGGASFRIFEEDKEDIFVPLSPPTVSNTYSIVTMDIDRPLTNSYTTNARIQLTDSSAEEVLLGCVEDLASWGIECRHYVYTYHSGSQHMPSQKAIDWVRKYFVSGRGRVTPSINQKDTIELHNLKSLSMGSTYAQIDNALDETANTGGLFIFYGHGETTKAITDKLEYLINGALDRGIRITTRTKALKLMGLM